MNEEKETGNKLQSMKFGTIIGMITTVSMLVAVTYELGYFSVVGFSFYSLLSFSDHLSNAIKLLPFTFLTLFLLLLFSVHFVRKIVDHDDLNPDLFDDLYADLEDGKGENHDEIEGRLNDIENRFELHQGKYKKIIFIAGMVSLVSSFFSFPSIIWYPFLILLFWLSFGEWVINKFIPNIEKKNFLYWRVLNHLPPAFILIFLFGAVSCYLAVSLDKNKWVLCESEVECVEVRLIGAYSSGVLFSYKNEFSFLNINKVDSIRYVNSHINETMFENIYSFLNDSDQ